MPEYTGAAEFLPLSGDIFRLMVENTPVGIMVLGTDLRIHYVNEHFLRMRGLQKEEAVGKKCFELINGGQPCSSCIAKKAIATGCREFIHRKDIQNSSPRMIDEYAIPLHNGEGKCDFVLEVIIDRTDEILQREHNLSIFIGIIDSLTSILDKKDLYTGNHSHDVTEVSVKLGRFTGLSDREQTQLRLASLLHDIGKIYVPDAIINKPAKLSDEEYALVKRHPEDTLGILDRLSLFTEIRNVAGHHHERWDGRGYPHGLRHEEIPLGSRILAIADSYDAMTSVRCYRRALSHDEAVQEIRSSAGTQFDPELALEFLFLTEEQYPDRDALVGNRKTKKIKKKTARLPNLQRHLTRIMRKTTRIIREREIADLLEDETFARVVMDNTPCYYIIVDRQLNVIFASASVVRSSGLSMDAILSRHCYEVSMVQSDCLGMPDGEVRCPAVRAFATGERQTGSVRIKARAGEPEMHCDIFAVPLSLTDAAGGKSPAVLEILFDRTDEAVEFEASQNDTKALIELLLRLAASIDPETTSHSEEIISECTSFSEYLSGRQAQMRRIVKSPSQRRRGLPPCPLTPTS